MDEYSRLDDLKCDFDFNFKQNITIPTVSRDGSDEPNNSVKVFKNSYGSKSLKKATEECVNEGRMIVNRRGQQSVDPECIMEKMEK